MVNEAITNVTLSTRNKSGNVLNIFNVSFYFLIKPFNTIILNVFYRVGIQA